MTGTPAYMSPEQAREEEVDHRTDLWSLGVVLYEMVAGRRPFQGEREVAVIHAILNERPQPLREVRPAVPAELEKIVDRLLAKDPEDRYPSTETPLAEIRALLGESTTHALPTWQRGRRFQFWLLGTLAGVAVLAGDLSLPLEQRRLRKLPPPPVPGFFVSSWSPEGRRLAGGAQGVFYFSLDTRRYERLTSSGYQPHWLGDGHRLLYLDQGEVLVDDLRTGQSRRILTPTGAPGFQSFDVTSEGSLLYTVRVNVEGDLGMLSLQTEME